MRTSALRQAPPKGQKPGKITKKASDALLGAPFSALKRMLIERSSTVHYQCLPTCLGQDLRRRCL